MDHQNTHRHVSRRSERKPYQPRDSGYGGSNSDSDSDIARRSASLSLAAPDFAELSEYGIRDQEDDILERLATHYEPLEGHDLLVRAFERTITGTVRASYRDGVRIHEVVDQAIQPKFGITFLPGADSPQVNQMEEIGMSETKPDQKDSAWRVSSAGALLMDFDVGKDGLISFRDLTPNIVVSARRRCGLENESHNRSSSKALAIRNHYDRIVTIDSNNVKIVNDLATEPWDLDALLVEVDQSSLMALLLNYRQIINNRGQNLPYLETIRLLDTMVEDARRFCIRSPILFRMSTRRQIIASKNTRYGVNTGAMFQTITTSSGIKGIISLSAAFFNSLGQYETKDQAMIRPRFLQMLVLLLSLLNDDDLKELGEFLKHTYQIMTDRYNLELLILKVLPLMSINSTIFLKALLTAFDGDSVRPSRNISNQPHVWSLFIQKLLQQKYILPATAENVGAEDYSWIVRWPTKGFQDSTIFKNLQYTGQLRTFNEIPPINLTSEVETSEITAVFANGQKYVVANTDLENIIRMIPGSYSVTESGASGRSYDMQITDMQVNQPIFKAIWSVNSILGLVRSILPVKPRNAVTKMLNGLISGDVFKTGINLRDSNIFPAEIKGSGRLTYHVAQVNGDMLAVAYKHEGRKISRRDLIRLLGGDINKIYATIRAIETTMRETFDNKKCPPHILQTINTLEGSLNQVSKHLREAERNKNELEKYSSQLRDEPVSQILYQNNADDSPLTVWHEYDAWHHSGSNILFIDSQREVIKEVNWQADGTIEIQFNRTSVKYFVSPLKQLEEYEKWEEIQVDDQVLLCGQYLMVIQKRNETFVLPPTGDHNQALDVINATRFELGANNGLPDRNEPQPYYNVGAEVGDQSEHRPDEPIHITQRRRYYEQSPESQQNLYHHQSGGQQPPFTLQHPLPQHHAISADRFQPYRPAYQQRQYTPPRPRRPVPPPPKRVELEMVVNWLKITGIETPLQNRRARRDNPVSKVRTYIS